jgi:hypothetical protein
MDKKFWTESNLENITSKVLSVPNKTFSRFQFMCNNILLIPQSVVSYCFALTSSGT